MFTRFWNWVTRPVRAKVACHRADKFFEKQLKMRDQHPPSV